MASGSNQQVQMRCPRCGVIAPSEFRFCEVDGTALVAEPVPATADNTPRLAEPVGGRCVCGQALDDGDGFCSACGHRIQSGQLNSDRTVTVLSPRVAGVTDRGRRHRRNEDALAIATENVASDEALVLVVCDGVSSSHDADVGARVAADTALVSLRAAIRDGGGDVIAALRDAIGAAHQAVCDGASAPEGSEDPAGTTIVAAVAANGRIDVGWVGDSRAYWIGDAGASRLTRDHSWAEEAIAATGITAAEAYRDPRAHAITHCLGPLETIDGGSAPESGLATFAPTDDGWLILCTDGFWNGVPEPADVARLLARAPNGDATSRAAYLVDHALSLGGLDNITVIAAQHARPKR
jgi:serine/threonine protein phosphatase PrpC